jgi:hypothetical protein
MKYQGLGERRGSIGPAFAQALRMPPHSLSSNFPLASRTTAAVDLGDGRVESVKDDGLADARDASAGRGVEGLGAHDRQSPGRGFLGGGSSGSDDLFDLGGGVTAKGKGSGVLRIEGKKA